MTQMTQLSGFTPSPASYFEFAFYSSLYRATKTTSTRYFKVLRIIVKDIFSESFHFQVRINVTANLPRLFPITLRRFIVKDL